jgi:ATP-dependent DNA helicase DinG
MGSGSKRADEVGGRSFSVDVLGVGGILSSKLPGYEYRPGQLHMALAVERAIRERRNLLIEAGTGTGKTFAYLVPAIGSRKKVVVSTGTKNLQDQLYHKDIPFLRSSLPISFSVCYMKGRNNYLCLRDFEEFRARNLFLDKEDAEIFPMIEEWVRETRTGDRAEMEFMPDSYATWREISADAERCSGRECPFFRDCFITKIREEAQMCDIVVVNHHLYFADISLRTFSDAKVLPDHDLVVFDEAHMIEDVGTDYFSVEISRNRIEELIRDVGRRMRILQSLSAADVLEALDTLRRREDQFFGELEGMTAGREGRWRLVPESGKRGNGVILGDPVLEAAERLCLSLDILASRLDGLRIRDDVISSCARRAREMKSQLELIIANAQVGGDEYVSWVEVRNTGRCLVGASPIDVAGILRELVWDRVDTAILTSATLTADGSFSFIRKRLGLEDADELVVESEFDHSRQALLYIPLHLPDPRDPEFPDAAADEIQRILKRSGGRAFLLFTSYEMMNKVYERLKDKLEYRIFRQGDMPKHSIISKFKDDIGSVLFATSSFWQGVDVQGEALSVVVVDKLPFPVPTDPITEARSERIEKEGGNPFRDYHLPIAIIMLKQGFGRLIRTKRDRGVLCVLDKRIMTMWYGKAFLRSIPRSPITHEIEDLERFFESP